MTSLKDFGFEDLKVIGRGQYGKAHLVRTEKEQFFYIAKTIDLTCLSSKEKETALQEVALLRRLDHPNIVQYKDNFFMSDTLVIIMQYCEGGDLQTFIKEKLKEKKRIQEVVVMHYFVQVLQALQYIHGERILHRDLKTSNLFLMKSKKVVKLGDFGISRVLEGSIEAAITVVGTPYYMSPEVCENKPYTFKSDVWSLGCVLYELCMLKHAFAADNLLGLVYKIVSDKYEPIPKLYSQNLNGLIQRMLEKDADKRPSVRDLLADSYVHSFMNEWVRTRGQCASAVPKGEPRVGSSTSNNSGTAPLGAQGTATRMGTSRAPSAGSSQTTATGPSGSRGFSTASSPPAVLGMPNSAGASTSPGEPRPPRPRQRVEAGERRSVVGTVSKKVGETPKEAALRRKREAADKKAAELTVAARQAGQNKLVARQMKETEFQSTRQMRAPSASGTAASKAAANTIRGGYGFGGTPETSPTGTGPLRHSDEDSGSLTPEEEDYDGPIDEEINEDYTDGSSEYQDDFDSDEDSMDEEVEEGIYVPPDGAGDYSASVKREDEDLGRVMANYEQDIRRGGTSPTRRSYHGAPIGSPPGSSPTRAGSPNQMVSVPVGSPTQAVRSAAATTTPGFGGGAFAAGSPGGTGFGPPAAASTAGGGFAGGGGAPAGGAIMDMHSRATKLQEELIHKMGQESFKTAFDYMFEARQNNVDDKIVRRELEALVGRDAYKKFCFDVDQLVFSKLSAPNFKKHG